MEIAQRKDRVSMIHWTRFHRHVFVSSLLRPRLQGLKAHGLWYIWHSRVSKLDEYKFIDTHIYIYIRQMGILGSSRLLVFSIYGSRARS